MCFLADISPLSLNSHGTNLKQGTFYQTKLETTSEKHVVILNHRILRIHYGSTLPLNAFTWMPLVDGAENRPIEDGQECHSVSSIFRVHLFGRSARATNFHAGPFHTK